MKKSPPVEPPKMLVVHSGHLPPSKPPPPNPWRQLKKFIAAADELLDYCDDLQKLRLGEAGDDRSSGDIEDEANWLQELMAKCRAGLARFDHAERYDQDDDGERVLKPEYISKRLGHLLDAFPTTNPGNPAGFLIALTEHAIAVDGLCNLAFETACREIAERETQKWAPTAGELVKVLQEHVGRWQRRRWALDSVERLRRELIETLAAREAEQRKQARDEEIRKATWAVKNAMDRTQRLIKEMEAAKAALAVLVQQHAAAEREESELNRKLRKLLGVDDDGGGEQNGDERDRQDRHLLH